MSTVSEFQTAGAEQRKSTVGEVGSGSRFADSWRCRRAKPTSDGARLGVTAEVDRGGTVVDLIRQDGQFVVDPLSDWKPMQLLE